MGGKVFKSVGKVLKKVAPIAAGAAGMYFGGPAGGALAGSLFGGGGDGGGGDFASGLGGMAGSLYNFYGQEKVDKGILEAQLRAAEEARNQLNPYAQAGTEATQRLSNRLAQGFQFNQGDLYNDPGYQFQFGEGERALNAQAARSGLLGSGRALKEATQYGQGMAEGQFGNVYNRNLNRWNLENAGMQNLTGTGLTAATGIGDLALATGRNRADYRVRRGQGRNDLSSGLLDNAGPVLGGIGNYLTNLGGEPAQVQGPPMPPQGLTKGVFGNYFAKSADMPLRTAKRRPMTRFGRQNMAQGLRLTKGMGGSNWKVIG
jgi:hypothetical protein